MRRFAMGVAALTLLAAPTFALADDAGAGAGAATGAVTGAIVGGPVGAVVGAGVGAVAGGAASGPNRHDTVVVAPGPAATGSTGCVSETVRRENSYGDSKTVTRESC